MMGGADIQSENQDRLKTGSYFSAIQPSLQQTHRPKKQKQIPLNLMQLLLEIHHILQMCWVDLYYNTQTEGC